MQNKCSDTAANTTHCLLQTIKQELHASMNGVASAAMRQTADYRVNFGVELPRLQTIAAEYKPDDTLAQALWKEPVRECRILATMIVDSTQMQADMADEWVAGISTAELAQTASINTFQHMPDAAQKALEWMAADDDIRQLCGLCTAYHLKRRGLLTTRQQEELSDQAQALAKSGNMAIRRVANNLS